MKDVVGRKYEVCRPVVDGQLRTTLQYFQTGLPRHLCDLRLSRAESTSSLSFQTVPALVLVPRTILHLSSLDIDA